MTVYLSRYQQRVKIVEDTLREHPDLSEKTAADLAVRVLAALDRIPEKMR